METSLGNQLKTTLCDLIRIPSVRGNPEKNAPYGKNTLKALEYMLNLGNEMGFKTVNLDGHAGYIEFGSGEKQLGILCHLDVVPAKTGWETDPFEPVCKDGKIIGRGALDDKGPAVACLYAMKSLKDEGFDPGCKIRLILGLDEESGMECIKHYRKKEPPPDTGFTPDAMFPVIYAEKGILLLKLEGKIPSPTCDKSDKIRLLKVNGGERANMIPARCSYVLEISTGSSNPSVVSETITGIPGHSKDPECGENAISKAMYKLAGIFSEHNSSHVAVDYFSKNIRKDVYGESFGISCSDSGSGKLTCNVGLIELDEKGFSVTLDIRYPVTADKTQIIETVKSKSGPFGVFVKQTTCIPPVNFDPEGDFIKTLLDAYNKTTGKSGVPIYTGGGTYARSIPNIAAFGPVYDPADDVAHQSGEYIRVENLVLCHDIYKDAMRELCKKLLN